MKEQKASLQHEKFLSFLEQKVQSDEYRELKDKAENGSHPTGDMLYDYVLGGLDVNEAKIIRKHILFCERCAEEVLRIRQVERELEKDLPVRLDQQILNGTLRQLVSKCKACFSVRVALGFAMTVAACLLIYFLTPDLHQNQLSDMIADSYQTAQTAFGPGGTGEILSFPWEKNEPMLGFASPEQDSPASRAFGAGLWSGRARMNELTSKSSRDTLPDFLSPGRQGDSSIAADDWRQTSWDIYFWLGEWCYLMQAVCHSDSEISYEFWEQQETVFKEIQKRFDATSGKSEKNVKTLKKVFQNIENIFKDSGLHRFDRTRRKELAFEINYVTDEFSPKISE
jgi:hypothetical protein